MSLTEDSQNVFSDVTINLTAYMQFTPFIKEFTRESFRKIDHYRSQLYFVSSTDHILSVYLDVLYCDKLH